MGPFRFKQFSVDHDRCAHPVGTDAVLLGSWVDVSSANTILDVGTGCGVIALMLAQRTASHVGIDALEPADADRAQAENNIARSPWASRVRVYPDIVQHYTTTKAYDLIVSNPPFFNDGQGAPSAPRGRARHTMSLPHSDLLDSATRLLAPAGKLAVVLPVTEGNEFESLARRRGLYTSRRLAVFSRKDKKPERHLMEFCHGPIEPETRSLVIYDSGGSWSNDYKRLTGEFYLAF